MKLSIQVLVDNCASSGFYAEHGLSYIIDYDTTILFDTGQSDLFLQNAKKLEISIDDIKTVVLSHGHYDHGNGLSFLSTKELICHPHVFLKHYSGKQRKYVGLNQSKEALQQHFNITESETPVWLSNNMVFLSEIPRKFMFEKHTTAFYNENDEPDLLLDDSAIAVKMPQGLFIITACSHSGICNIIDYAKRVTGIEQVFGVFGGFHLKQNNEQTKQTIEYLTQQNVQVVMTSHCTELSAQSIIYETFKGEQVKAGIRYTFDAI